MRTRNLERQYHSTCPGCRTRSFVGFLVSAELMMQLLTRVLGCAYSQTEISTTVQRSAFQASTRGMNPLDDQSPFDKISVPLIHCWHYGLHLHASGLCTRNNVRYLLVAIIRSYRFRKVLRLPVSLCIQQVVATVAYFNAVHMLKRATGGTYRVQ